MKAQETQIKKLLIDFLEIIKSDNNWHDPTGLLFENKMYWIRFIVLNNTINQLRTVLKDLIKEKYNYLIIINNDKGDVSGKFMNIFPSEKFQHAEIFIGLSAQHAMSKIQEESMNNWYFKYKKESPVQKH